MSRRQLLLLAGCMLLAPALVGAYYPSCNKTTIGFYPNYPFRPASDSTAVSRANSSQIHGSVLFVDWNDQFYNCPLGGCTVSGCSGGSCTINLFALNFYIKPFLDQWVLASNPSPLNLEIVFVLHTAGFGSTAVGPGHIRPLGVTSTTTRAAFKSFYDAVYNILKSPQYNDPTGPLWLFSIGNEVNLYLRWSTSAWSHYTDFYNEIKAYIKDTTLHPGYWPRVGVSTAYFGNLQAPGLWSLAGTPPVNQPDTFGTGKVQALNATSDAIILTYYPVDAEHNYRALNPSRVSSDISYMEQVAASVSRPVVLQEVGYPTDNNLHASSDSVYSTYASGEQAQGRFVLNLMNAIKTHDASYTVDAASWWPLFDFGSNPDATSGDCWNFAAGVFGSAGQNIWFRRWICTMGLVRSNNTNKLAWPHFEQGALDAPNW